MKSKKTKKRIRAHSFSRGAKLIFFGPNFLRHSEDQLRDRSFGIGKEMDILEFFPTKINKAEGETLWNEIEASLRSLYHYEGDLRYFLEHRESTRAGKSVSFNVPVSVTRHSKNGYDPSFDLESPEGARMTAWLSKKNVLGSGKLVLLTLKSYGRMLIAR